MNKGLSIPSVCRKLTEYGSFLIFTHIAPDGDTLGSAFALKRIFDVMGKRTEVVCADRVPERLKFLVGQDDLSLGRLQNFVPDCIVTVDIADAKLLGKELVEFANKIDVCIDHHAKRTLEGRFMHIRSDASSCGEIIYEIAKQFEKTRQGSLDDIAARYLYAAISSDTGGFVYSNVTPRTMRIAADLLGYDIDAPELNERLHKYTTKDQLALQADLIQNMRYYDDGRIACVYLDQSKRERFGLDDDDVGDIVNIPRQVQGVLTAFSVKEKCEGVYKVSLRTKYADASAIAAKFGGGGHVRAAGCTVDAENMVQCLEKVSAACIEETKDV